MLEPGATSVAAEALPLKVFINYRREDTQGLAWGLYWPLAAQFGRDNVFLDNGELRGGDQWLAEIKAHIAEADVFLALVGPRWQETLDQRLRQGGRDYVAAEIELALLRKPGLTVMAVVVDDARSPRATNLPNALKGLAAGHVERIRQA
jgi:TIR domain